MNNGHGHFAPASQPPPPAYPPPSEYAMAVPAPVPGHGQKRPWTPENPQQIDTVASVGAAEKGVDEAMLHNFFMSLPGFLMFKANPKMGGGFAKFESAMAANQAIVTAHQQGIPAEVAKSCMGGAPSQPPPPAYPPPAAKRPRTAENPGQVDTVACVGAAERGFDEAGLHAFFAEQPGFLVFRANPRMGGGFAKFESPDMAAQAIALAQEQGVPAEIAKSSMSQLN